jgi:hypothetical protein
MTEKVDATTYSSRTPLDQRRTAYTERPCTCCLSSVHLAQWRDVPGAIKRERVRHADIARRFSQAWSVNGDQDVAG